jgi:DNA-directed RNA polymerase specialized sigma24 family protein
MSGETAIGKGGRVFPDTRWTLILRSRDSPEARRVALSELLGLYWRPLYFFARRKGLDVEAAKDAVQGLFLRLIEREGDLLDRLEPGKGRFRGYLRTALNHHLANLHEQRTAQKRGGDAGLLTGPAFDLALAEQDLAASGSGVLSPEAAFDHEWALGVLHRALSRLREEFESGQRRGPFALVLRFFELGRPGAPPSYAEAAAESGMSVPQFKAFLHRARLRFSRLVREEVAPTLAEAEHLDAGADAEIAELMRALSG